MVNFNPIDKDYIVRWQSDLENTKERPLHKPSQDQSKFAALGGVLDFAERCIVLLALFRIWLLIWRKWRRFEFPATKTVQRKSNWIHFNFAFTSSPILYFYNWENKWPLYDSITLLHLIITLNLDVISGLKVYRLPRMVFGILLSSTFSPYFRNPRTVSYRHKSTE